MNQPASAPVRPKEKSSVPLNNKEKINAYDVLH